MKIFYNSTVELKKKFYIPNENDQEQDNKNDSPTQSEAGVTDDGSYIPPPWKSSYVDVSFNLIMSFLVLDPKQGFRIKMGSNYYTP